MKNKKAGVVSLGCDKNRVDTECLLAFLTEGGFTICQTPEDCQILIVNTCAFLNEARAEAIDTVLEFAELKKAGLEKLIVTGCLPQKWAEECREGLAVVRAAKELGVRHMVLTHADNPADQYTVEEQPQAAALGALVEHSYFTTYYQRTPAEEIARLIPLLTCGDLDRVRREVKKLLQMA